MMRTKDTKRALAVSAVAGMFSMAWFTIAYGIPITMLFESLTGSGIIIGLFTALVQLSAVFQIPSALFSEYFTSRKKYWSVITIIHQILWLSPVILILFLWNRPNLAALLLIFILAVAAAFGNSGTVIWLDWMADIIPKEISARYWGLRQSLTAITFFAATAASGYLLDIFPSPEKEGGSYTGFLIVFSLGAAAGISGLLLHMKVPDAKREFSPQAGLLRKLLLPMKNLNFRNMTLAYASWFLAMGVVGPFGFVYLKRVFDASYTDLSIIAASAMLSAAIFGAANGILIDRVGARAYSCIAFAISPLFWLVWFFAGDTVFHFNIFSLSLDISENVLLISAASFIAGIFVSGAAICQLHLANAIADKSWRTIGIAEHWALVGFVSAAGPFIGGAITDYFNRFPLSLPIPSGQNMSYIHILVILAALTTWTAAIPFILKVKMTKEEMSVGKAISVIYLYPIRGFGAAYNIIGSITGFGKNNKL